MPTDLVALARRLHAEGRSLFLGWSDGSPVFANRRDQVTVIGPPGSGKSSAIFAPSIACHPGPVIVTSVRASGLHPDLRDITLKARLEMAAASGGIVHELAIDEAIAPVESPVWWDLIEGCKTWNASLDRARMLAGACIPLSSDNAQAWRNSVVSLLAPLLHAAAISELTDVDLRAHTRSAEDVLGADERSFSSVRFCLADRYGEDHPAVHSCDSHLSATLEVQKNVRYVVDIDILGILSYERSISTDTFDVESFFSGWSTLYITVRPARSKQVRPLIAAMIDSMANDWQSRPYDSMNGTLLLALDEVANVAPVAALPEIVAGGGGSGIQCMLGFQDPAQAVAHWGPGDAETVVKTAANTVIFQGLSNRGFLEDIATLFGEGVQYQREVVVAPDAPSSARGADAKYLIAEREELESSLQDVAPALRAAAERIVAQRLLERRRRRGVRFLDERDDELAAQRLIDEVRRYTSVVQRPVRRGLLEPGAIFKGEPGRVFVKRLNDERVPEFAFHTVFGYWKDPLWSQWL